MRHRTACCPVAILLGVLTVVSVADPSGAQSPPREGDDIRAEFKGRLTRAAGAGGEHTGFQITASGVTWEVDASADSALLRKAEELAGTLAVATGTYTERRGTSRVRRILTVQALESGTATGRGEYVDVTVRGMLKAGVIAIGAETTGVTVTAGPVTWELELRGSQYEIADELNGGQATVSGQLRHDAGIEIGSRFIVTPRSIKSAL